MTASDLHKEESHEQLIGRLKQGEEAAMKHVFREYYWRLHYFSFKMTGDMAGAEDIVQEAFLNFWINIKDKGVVPVNIQAYLYRMVRNRCMNYLERQRVVQERNGKVTERFYNSCHQQMDEIAVMEELFHRVTKEFTHLTPIQAQVMELLYLEGLPVAEVALQLGTTVNNIRNHKARALERLRAIIKNAILLLLLFF